MRNVFLLSLAAGLLTASHAQAQITTGAAVQATTPAAGAAIGGTATANPDHWRYVRHNNQWWYYTPQNSWLRWNGSAWYPHANAGGYGYGGFGQPYASGYRGYGYGYGYPSTYYGAGVGANVGANVGGVVGGNVGSAVGANVGVNVGGTVGNAVGTAGNAVGGAVGGVGGAVGGLLGR